MKLTIEDNRVAIKRYGHIKAARGFRARLCANRCPGTTRTCSRVRGHSGPHVAHGLFQKVVAVWDSGPGGPYAGEPARRLVEARGTSGVRDQRPVGMRVRRPHGLVKTLWTRLREMSSLEEAVFFLFFLAFVGFAVHWFWLILG